MTPVSRRRYAVFALVAVALSALLAGAALLAADLYLHHRAERSAGLNAWGYRGKSVGRKAPGEVRIAFLGGSTMFGYGGPWEEAVPAVTASLLNARVPEGVRVSGVNLAMNNEGAYSFWFTLQDYAYLDFDLAVLDSGYNDLGGDEGTGNQRVFRHESAVFRLTGYMPILPMYLQERALMFRHGGDLDAAYRSQRGEAGVQTVFRPGAADRSAAAALELADTVGEALGRQLGRVPAAGLRQAPDAEGRCVSPWRHYCDSVTRAVEYAISQGVHVLVVAQPTLTGKPEALHRDQQQALAGLIERRFKGHPQVTYVDLSAAVDLDDPGMTFDKMHLTPQGNAAVARVLSDVLAPLVTALASQP